MKLGVNLSPVSGLLALLRLAAPPAPPPPPIHTDEKRELLTAVQQAHREWEAAQSYFAAVADPELVDHAIFVLEAAERKYRYLMKLAREREYID